MPATWKVSVRRSNGIDRSLRSEEHTSELQLLRHLVCRLLLEKKTEKGDRAVPEAPEAPDDSRVVETPATAVERDEVGQDAIDVVERVRTVTGTRELDRAPDVR